VPKHLKNKRAEIHCMQIIEQHSMAHLKVASMLSTATKNERLHGALIIFLGALFLLSAFPFYPVYVVIFLAAVCGAVAYRSPPLGLIAGAVLAFPAVIWGCAC